MEMVSYDICSIEKESFLKGTPYIRKMIVDIGCNVYDNLHFWVNIKSSEDDNKNQKSDEIIKELEKQLQESIKHRDEYVECHISSKNIEIESLKRRLEESDNVNEKKMKEEREYYTNQLNVLKDDMDKHVELNLKPKENEINYLKSALFETRENMEKQKEEELRRLEEHQKVYVDSLKRQIEQLEKLCEMQDSKLKEKEKNKSMNVVRMGQIGEASVEDYINLNFNEGNLQNTTKTGGQGDLHFMYKDCDILLEVKNKDRITPDDITKFIRDVKETDSIGGVFISIKPNVKIPCHSCYDVEWINDKAIIYISSFETIPDMLYVAIKTIHYYHSKKGDISEESTKYKDELCALIENVKLFKPILDDACINMKRSMDSIHRLQHIIKDQLHVYFNNEETRGNKLAIILKISNEFFEMNKRLPSYDELAKMPGLSRKDISNAGGMQCIKDEYKNKYN